VNTKHTPGPWIHDTRGYPHPDVRAASGRKIACTWGVNNQPKTKEAYEAQKQIARANADHIVKCVNAHDELTEALRLGFSIQSIASGVLVRRPAGTFEGVHFGEAHLWCECKPSDRATAMQPLVRAAIEAHRAAIAKATGEST
jgi:hypothetical protein